MRRGSQPPALEWPKPKLWLQGWANLVQFVVTVILFFVPSFSKEAEPWAGLRITVGILLVLLPFVGPLIVWAWKAAFVVYRRVRWYPPVRSNAIQEGEDLLELRNTVAGFLERITGGTVHRIMSAHFDLDTQKMYLVVERLKTPKLGEGMMFSTNRLSDTTFMGWFQIKEVFANEYHLVAYANVERLWASFVQQERRVDIVPDIVALYIPGRPQE